MMGFLVQDKLKIQEQLLNMTQALPPTYTKKKRKKSGGRNSKRSTSGSNPMTKFKRKTPAEMLRDQLNKTANIRDVRQQPEMAGIGRAILTSTRGKRNTNVMSAQTQ